MANDGGQPPKYAERYKKLFCRVYCVCVCRIL